MSRIDLAISLVIPPVTAALLSTVLGHLVFKDTTWQQAFYTFPYFFLAYQALTLLVATPVVLLLRKLRISSWLSCPTVGIGIPAIVLNIIFPYADHWYSYWPYWMAGGISGVVAAYLVTRTGIKQKPASC